MQINIMKENCKESEGERERNQNACIYVCICMCVCIYMLYDFLFVFSQRYCSAVNIHPFCCIIFFVWKLLFNKSYYNCKEVIIKKGATMYCQVALAHACTLQAQYWTMIPFTSLSLLSNTISPIPFFFICLWKK